MKILFNLIGIMFLLIVLYWNSEMGYRWYSMVFMYGLGILVGNTDNIKKWLE